MYIKRESDGLTVVWAYHIPNQKTRPAGLDNWFTLQNACTALLPRLRSNQYYSMTLSNAPMDNYLENYGSIDTTTFPSNVTLPLINHRKALNIRENQIGRMRSYYDRVEVSTLDNSPIVESYQVRSSRYGRNSVDLVPPDKFYYFTSFQHHEITISEQTELISAFSQIVLDKFVPEDGQGFIQLNLGGDDQRLTTTIDHYVETNHSIRNGSAPGRAWQNFFNSSIPIDEFSHFSFVDDEKFSLITDNSRVIKAIEINNFYRGSETTWEIVDVPISKLHKGNYIFPLVSEVKVFDIQTLTSTIKKIVVFAVQREWRRVIRYNRSRNFIADLMESFRFADGLKFFDPEKYEAEMKKRYGDHVKYSTRVTQVWRGEFTPGLQPNEIFSDNSLTPEHFAPMFSISSLNSNPEYRTCKEILETRKEISQKQEKAQRELQNSIHYLNDTLSHIEDKKRHIERLQNIIEEHTSKLDVYRLDIDKHEKTTNGLEEAAAQITIAATEAEAKIINIEENISPDIEASAKWIDNLAKTGIRVIDITYTDPDGRRISIKDEPSIGLKARQPNHHYRLYEIRFETNKPLVINVDRGSKGDACEKVVGGPYSVRVTSSDLYINLATSTACFGWNQGEYIWVHPHSGSFWVGIDSNWETFASQLVSHTARACLGEASPIIYTAFTNNDVKSAIMGALIWITSANSNDTWGKNYKFFPSVNEVTFPTISIKEDQAIVVSSEPTEQSESSITDSDSAILEHANHVDAAVADLADLIQGWNDDQADQAEENHIEVGIVNISPGAQEALLQGWNDDMPENLEEETDQEPEVNDENLRSAGRPDYRPLLPDPRRYARTTPVTE